MTVMKLTPNNDLLYNLCKIKSFCDFPLHKKMLLRKLFEILLSI